MAISARDYGGLDDLRAILGLATLIASRVSSQVPLWHRGNAVWNLYTGMQAFDPRDATNRIRLWWDGAEVAGVAVDLGDGEVHVDVRTWEASGPALWAEACAWAEAQALASGATTCTLLSLESDGERLVRLEDAGYTRAGRGNPRMRLSLDAQRLPELPADLRFRDCVEIDLDERAAAHRDAWEHLEHLGIDGARSAFSRDLYERLRGAPGYDPTLDFVVEDAGGGIVASCICWADDANGSGLFEPVGTRLAHRHRGLARALVLGALARLRARGLRVAQVGTAHFNEPALRTYLSCGFEVIDQEVPYVKRASYVQSRRTMS